MKKLWRLTLISTLFLIVDAAIAQSPSPPPSYPDISGDWICTDMCQNQGGLAKIGQDGGYLTFINEVGKGTTGFFEGDKRIRAVAATGWSDLRAVISNDLRQVNWANGTVWRKK